MEPNSVTKSVSGTKSIFILLICEFFVFGMDVDSAIVASVSLMLMCMSSVNIQKNQKNLKVLLM